MLAHSCCVILSHLLSVVNLTVWILLYSNHELNFNIGMHVLEQHSTHMGLMLSVVSAVHWGSWIDNSLYGGQEGLLHALGRVAQPLKFLHKLPHHGKGSPGRAGLGCHTTSGGYNACSLFCHQQSHGPKDPYLS